MGNQPADLTAHRLKIDLSSDPVEVRPFEVRLWFDLIAVNLHGPHATSQPTALPERPDWQSFWWDLEGSDFDEVSIRCHLFDGD